jgi:hypothetical protein
MSTVFSRSYPELQAAVDHFWDVTKREQDERDEELELGDLDVWVRAESIAHDAAEIESLQSDGVICLADIKVKVAGQWIGADRAMYQVALHHMAGRYEQADCVARDTVNEIAKALEPLVRSGRVKWEV